MGFLDTVKRLGSEPAFLATLAAPLVGAGLGAANDYRKKLHEAKAKTVSYRRMMELNPRLKLHDQKEVGLIYDSLHNVNPMLARDPLVASAWVDNIMENKIPGTDSHQSLLVAVKDLAGIRSSLSQALRNEKGDSGKGVESFMMNAGRALESAQEKGLGRLVKQKNEEIERLFDDERSHHLQHVWGEELKLDARDAELKHRETALQGYAQDLHGHDKKSSAPTELEGLLSALGIA